MSDVDSADQMSTNAPAFLMRQVERMEKTDSTGDEKVVKSQWMEARIVVYTPDEISDEEVMMADTSSTTTPCSSHC